MDDERFIWISRWEEFQTYQKKRGKPWAPPWIRTYPRQLDDDAYLSLTEGERLLVRELREIFATQRGELGNNTARLTRRLGHKVMRRQLESLNHAGFIQFCSGTVLEQKRNAFWNTDRLEVEVEEDVDKTSAVDVGTNGHIDLDAYSTGSINKGNDHDRI